jgi:acyl carrier protein
MTTTNSVDHEGQISTRVREIIARMSPVKPQQVEPEDRLIEDLGYDSLAIIELALELERELELGRIEEEQAMDIVCVHQVEELVARALGASESAA